MACSNCRVTIFCSANLHVCDGALVDKRWPNLSINQAMIFIDNLTPVRMAMRLDFIQTFFNKVYSS